MAVGYYVIVSIRFGTVQLYRRVIPCAAECVSADIQSNSPQAAVAGGQLTLHHTSPRRQLRRQPCAFISSLIDAPMESSSHVSCLETPPVTFSCLRLGSASAHVSSFDLSSSCASYWFCVEPSLLCPVHARCVIDGLLCHLLNTRPINPTRPRPEPFSPCSLSISSHKRHLITSTSDATKKHQLSFSPLAEHYSPPSVKNNDNSR